MGKKRIIKKEGGTVDQELKARSLSKISKKKLASGILHIQSTYNNTILTITDSKGNMVMWASSGSLGFKGAKKGTPFAASKVAELLAEKAKMVGIKDVDVVIKGVGAGRESAIRTFAAKGIEINLIRDRTPVPHGGVKPRKPRRV
ncbi:MAG: 30S ribosomal protein S11 [Candidatus Terrybacteria bacterium]|nr:30S ribosomal protein S11 [Candidatus Terrybacteria bacterium]